LEPQLFKLLLLNLPPVFAKQDTENLLQPPQLVHQKLLLRLLENVLNAEIISKIVMPTEPLSIATTHF